ncbi:MAG TPA: class I SAM-dependent methyltransferase [Candidatus Limnocylindrales bacterium]|nr:class I SAM-dependent methyltransferase [Candidatus Limnocylindrales bacterium]
MPPEYTLLDAGDARRLERFGDRTVLRPAPGATSPRRDPDRWSGASAVYEREAGSTGRWVARDREPWQLGIRDLRLELRLAAGGQVGLFPEHLQHADWLRDRVVEAGGGAVLHLFAYTGALSLVAAAAGASVAHVDASRSAVAWARRNAELSGLGDRPIRWLVDDAERFVGRELTRRRSYVGAIVDPPSYGHGPAGRAWRLSERLDGLLRGVVGLLEGPQRFLLLTAHTPGFGPQVLAGYLGSALDDWSIEAGELGLTAETGARLPLGAFARWSAAASASPPA